MAAFTPDPSMPWLPNWQSSGLGPVLASPQHSMICMKSVRGTAPPLVGLAPFQVTVMPWWLMLVVWLTATWMFAKSGYMNDSWPVPAARAEFGASSVPPSVLADVVSGWLLASSRPLVQLTV